MKMRKVIAVISIWASQQSVGCENRGNLVEHLGQIPYGNQFIDMSVIEFHGHKFFCIQRLNSDASVDVSWPVAQLPLVDVYFADIDYSGGFAFVTHKRGTDRYRIAYYVAPGDDLIRETFRNNRDLKPTKFEVPKTEEQKFYLLSGETDDGKSNFVMRWYLNHDHLVLDRSFGKHGVLITPKTEAEMKESKKSEPEKKSDAGK